MTPIITVDPSTSCFGLAWGVAEHGNVPTPTLRRVLVLDEPGGVMERTALERLWPALDHARDELLTALGYRDCIPLDFTIKMAIERPPPTFKDKGDGRAKRQAVIGVGIGRAMELAAAWAYMQNRHTRIVDASFVENGLWRTWAADKARTAPDAAPKLAARAVAPVAAITTALPPVRNPAGAGWVTRYRGCDHEIVCETLTALQVRPMTCRACAGAGSASSSRASKASAASSSAPSTSKPHPLEHKKPWVELATRLWPDAVEGVVREARAGARASTGPYQLTGVADACDAALLLGFMASKV